MEHQAIASVSLSFEGVGSTNLGSALEADSSVLAAHSELSPGVIANTSPSPNSSCKKLYVAAGIFCLLSGTVLFAGGLTSLILGIFSPLIASLICVSGIVFVFLGCLLLYRGIKGRTQELPHHQAEVIQRSDINRLDDVIEQQSRLQQQMQKEILLRQNKIRQYQKDILDKKEIEKRQAELLKYQKQWDIKQCEKNCFCEEIEGYLLQMSKLFSRSSSDSIGWQLVGRVIIILSCLLSSLRNDTLPVERAGCLDKLRLVLSVFFSGVFPSLVILHRQGRGFEHLKFNLLYFVRNLEVVCSPELDETASGGLSNPLLGDNVLLSPAEECKLEEIRKAERERLTLGAVSDSMLRLLEMDPFNASACGIE